MNYCLNQRKLTLKQFDTLMRVVNYEINHNFHFVGPHKREIYLAIMNYGKSNEGLDAFLIQTIKGDKKYTPVNFDMFLKLLKAYKKRRYEINGGFPYSVNKDGTITMMGIVLTKDDLENMLRKLLKW